MEEKGILVREADRWLNTDAYLEEHHWWASCRLHHQFLLQRMFLHGVAMVQKEYNCAICWGWWEPSPQQDLEAEPYTVELMCLESTREKITEIYWDVYQLWRSTGELPCDGEKEEILQQEILDSIKECLQCKWVPTPPGKEPSWCPADIPRLDPKAEYSAQNCNTYDWFKDIKWGPCEEALAMVRDAHQQAPVAIALLEDKKERLSCSLSCGCSHPGSCRCSGNCRHLGSHQWISPTASCQTEVPQVVSHHEKPTRRQSQSPSPMQLRQWVTSGQPQRGYQSLRTPLNNLGGQRGSINPSHWSRPETGPEEEDLECPPSLDPHIEEFLGGKRCLFLA